MFKEIEEHLRAISFFYLKQKIKKRKQKGYTGYILQYATMIIDNDLV